MRTLMCMDIISVISSFGGIRPMARTLGHANHTTVQGWKRRGLIPAHQQASVIKAAEQTGISIDAVDLIPGLQATSVCPEGARALV